MLTVFLFTYELTVQQDRTALSKKIENKLTELSKDTDGWISLNDSSYAFSTHFNDYKVDAGLDSLFDDKDSIYLLALDFPADGGGGAKAIANVEWISAQLRKTPVKK